MAPQDTAAERRPGASARVAAGAEYRSSSDCASDRCNPIGTRPSWPGLGHRLKTRLPWARTAAPAGPTIQWSFDAISSPRKPQPHRLFGRIDARAGPAERISAPRARRPGGLAADLGGNSNVRVGPAERTSREPRSIRLAEPRRRHSPSPPSPSSCGQCRPGRVETASWFARTRWREAPPAGARPRGRRPESRRSR
jgi:hypothetical protein